MLLQTEALYQHVSRSDHDRSLEAARKYELNEAVRRQRRLHKSRKGTARERWVALGRPA